MSAPDGPTKAPAWALVWIGVGWAMILAGLMYVVAVIL